MYYAFLKNGSPVLLFSTTVLSEGISQAFDLLSFAKKYIVCFLFDDFSITS